MIDENALLALAGQVYDYAVEHYGDKDARFDVIVECMSKTEIADELRGERIFDKPAALRWADKRAGLHHEQELNQAWDGPESCIGSSKYDPAHDPAGPPCPACGKPDCDHECAAMDKLMAPDFIEHTDSHTGYPHYSANSDRARRMMGEEYDASDAPPYGNMF
jgi:hypothetical protein